MDIKYIYDEEEKVFPKYSDVEEYFAENNLGAKEDFRDWFNKNIFIEKEETSIDNFARAAAKLLNDYCFDKEDCENCIFYSFNKNECILEKRIPFTWKESL